MAVYALQQERGKNDPFKQKALPICVFLFFQERYTIASIKENFVNFMVHFGSSNGNIPLKAFSYCNSDSGGDWRYSSPLFEKRKNKQLKLYEKLF